MLQAYVDHVAERAALGIPPLPLSAKQTADLIELLKNPPPAEADFLLNLITHRVPAGVDDAAKVKASYLAAVAHGTEKCTVISREKATELLGTMLGGYNISPLIDLLDDAEVGGVAAEGLKKTLLMFDQFHDVKEKADKGNANAKAVLQSWADAEWFTSRPEVPQSIKVTIFKVTGETNTDDLSPAPDAWSRPDIPLHALAMLQEPAPRHHARGRGQARPGEVHRGAARARQPGGLRRRRGRHRLHRASRPPTRCCGSPARTSPSCRTSASAASAWAARSPRSSTTPWKTPARCRSSWTSRKMEMGDVVELRPYEGKALKNGEVIAEFKVKSDVLFDEVRAGGRIPLIIGRGLTAKAREALGLPPSTLFRLPHGPADTRQGLHAGAEDGRPRLRPARRQGRAPRHLLRAAA